MLWLRTSLKFVSYRDRKTAAAGLKRVYTSPTEEAALLELEEFCKTWDEKYPMIGKSW